MTELLSQTMNIKILKIIQWNVKVWIHMAKQNYSCNLSFACKLVKSFEYETFSVNSNAYNVKTYVKR